MFCIKTWYQPKSQPNTAGFNNIFPWLIPLEFTVSGGKRGFCGWIGWSWEEGRHSDEWRLNFLTFRALKLTPELS